jgi:hypothetical protein
MKQAKDFILEYVYKERVVKKFIGNLGWIMIDDIKSESFLKVC